MEVERADRTPEQPGQDTGLGLPSRGALEVAPGVTLPAAAVRFSAARASGPGGQNVNRRATKVELRVYVDALPLNEATKDRLRRLAGRRVNNVGELILVAQAARTQGQNRRRCLAELADLIVRARQRPKVRKKTQPSRGSKERRLQAKRERSEVKRQRSRTRRDDW